MIARHAVAVLLLVTIVAEAALDGLDGTGFGFSKRSGDLPKGVKMAIDALDGEGIAKDNIPGRKRAARPHDGIEGEGMNTFETSGGGKKRAVYGFGRGARY